MQAPDAPKVVIDSNANLADSLNPVMSPHVTPELIAERIGSHDYPFIGKMVMSPVPDIVLDQLETDKPYPLRMAWLGHSNFLSPTCSAQPKRYHDALKKTMEFAACTDIFMNPTAMAIADVFLPVSSFAEHDDMVQPHYGMNLSFVGASNKAITVGEAKSDMEIMLELRRLLWPDDETFTKKQFLDTKAAKYGMSWDGMQEAVTWQPPSGQWYKKYETGLIRMDKQPGFETASGRVELYCNAFVEHGEDPLPYYEEPRWNPQSRPEYAREYPLIMTTGARTYTSFHSEHRQIPSLRAITPDPTIEIHPDTAAELGIAEGDWCLVENMFGSSEARAIVTPITLPQVVSCTHGWWFPEDDPEEPSLFGVWKSNVNSLIPHKEVGKLGFGAPYKSMMVKVRKLV
jgi:anaerobic selenocysteine-containing dehydrogenase